LPYTPPRLAGKLSRWNSCTYRRRESNYLGVASCNGNCGRVHYNRGLRCIECTHCHHLPVSVRRAAAKRKHCARTQTRAKTALCKSEARPPAAGGLAGNLAHGFCRCVRSRQVLVVNEAMVKMLGSSQKRNSWPRRPC